MVPNPHIFSKKKLQKSVTIWEYLPKMSTIDYNKKNVTICGHGLYFLQFCPVRNISVC